jgi:hypothetical protein
MAHLHAIYDAERGGRCHAIIPEFPEDPLIVPQLENSQTLPPSSREQHLDYRLTGFPERGARRRSDKGTKCIAQRSREEPFRAKQNCQIDFFAGDRSPKNAARQATLQLWKLRH